MKIAIIKKDYKSGGGGAERYAREVATRLAKLGNQIYIHSESFENKIAFDGIFHVPVRRGIIRGFSSTISFHRNVQKTIVPQKYDLTYAISRTYPSDVFRVTESLHFEWMKTRYSRLQMLNPRHAQILSLEKKIFTSSNTRFVICNSELIRKQICENFSYPADNIFVIRNGVNHEEFKPASKLERCEIRKALNLVEDSFVLLFAASDFRIKGLEFAMRAIGTLPEKPRKKIVMLIVGAGKKNYFMKLAMDLGITDNVRFEGIASSIRNYYVASDILIHPALYEPFANVCIEALACGLPVLTTSANGSSELIRNGENGFIVESAKQYHDIAVKIQDFMLLSEDTRQAFSLNAINSVKHLSWEKHVEELIKIFNEKSRKKP